VIHGIGDNPAQPFARFHGCFEAYAPLKAWLQMRLAEFERDSGVVVGELIAPFEANPNLLARPKIAKLAIQVWGGGAVSPRLQGVVIRRDASGSLHLKIPSISRPVVVCGFSAANLAGRDPVSELLLMTGLNETPWPNFHATALSTSAERTTGRTSPVLQLKDGSILRPRRTVISGDSVQSLARLTPANRYIRWQQLGAKHGWSRLVQLTFSGEPALLVAGDSPLALEAAFHGRRNRMQDLVVEELVGRPWLSDIDGHRYIAQLALPFTQKSRRSSYHLLRQGDKEREPHA